MAEGFIDSAWEGTKKLVASATDATTNAAKSGAEGVRSYVQDIALAPDDIILLKTDPRFQMGAEVIDGALDSAEQNKLAQKVIQNFKTRRDIDELLEKVKDNARLSSLVKSYAFPEREKGTELRPSTSGDDVGMFVDSSFGTIKSIGKGLMDTTAWGDSPNERIDNLQKEVIMQAKRTRFAVHNMIAKSPEWFANPSLGFSPRHDSSGITDPYLPWNTLADRDPKTSVGQEDITENTHEHGLENLESIIDVMVGAARNPKNLDSNLDPRSASIVVPGEITNSSREFGSDYENELLFALQFLQAMEKGANEADTGMIMGIIKDHPWISGGAGVIFVVWILARLGSGAIDYVKGRAASGSKILKPLGLIASLAERMNAKNNLATAKLTAEAAQIAGEAGDEAKFETVEGVKIPKDIAESAKNMLEKLGGKTPLTEAIFMNVELDELGKLVTGSDAANNILPEEERIRRIKYIRNQLELFGNGKINELELKDGIAKGYDGRYRYEGVKAVLSNIGPIADNTKKALGSSAVGKWEKVKKAGRVGLGVGKDALSVAGDIGVGTLEQLTRKGAQKVGLGGNLQTDATLHALKNADKLEPFEFVDQAGKSAKWNMNDPKYKPLAEELNALLKSRESLKTAQKLLSEVKNKKDALEKLESRLAVTDQTVEVKEWVPSSGVVGAPPVERITRPENPAYKLLIQQINGDGTVQNIGARGKLDVAVAALQHANPTEQGIDLSSLASNSSMNDIDKAITEVKNELTKKGGIDGKIKLSLEKLSRVNTETSIPKFTELTGSAFENMMKILPHIAKPKPNF